MNKLQWKEWWRNERISKKEIGKDIPGYNGKYQASNLGKIKGKKGIMRPYINLNGHYSICTYLNGKRKTRRLHRLIADTFLGFSELQVNHIDGNKLNNNIDNLEYCTLIENIRHAYRTGLMTKNGLHGHPKKVGAFKNGVLVHTFSSMMNAERGLGIDYSGISNCIRGKQKTAGGFEWKGLQ